MITLTSVNSAERKDRQGNRLPNDSPGFNLGKTCREAAGVRTRFTLQPEVVTGPQKKNDGDMGAGH